jgi:hypothetical protein
MPQIHEYYPSPPDKVFMLASPVHMLYKLRWEISQLKTALTEEQETIDHAPAYHAFNCSVTAWHIADWIWEASTPRDREYILNRLDKTSTGEREDWRLFQMAIRDKCRSIHICRQLATGAKHMTVDQHPDPMVRTETLWRSAEIAASSEVNGDDQRVTYPYKLMIWDDDVQRSAVEVFEDAFECWQRLLRDWGFLEARFIDSTEP